MLQVARSIRGALLAALLLPVHASAASPPLADLALEDAIAVLQAGGLRVFYSTDLVKPWMRVTGEPAATEPAAILAEILAPHGLARTPGANQTWLVVRDPAAETVAGPADPEPAAPTPRPAATRRPALEEVIVATSRYPLQGATGNAPFVLTGAQLEALPEIGDDALRPISRLPGTASNGFSARSHVRGGELDETLLRIDGLRLYDPFHLKDFQSVFSVVDPRVVDTIDVYTGGFPAQFGDRMSSVIDVDTIQPPSPRYHEVGLSFFNTSVLSAGQVDDGRGEWLLSARRSNLDLLYQAFSDLPERPRYLDVFTKFSYELDKGLRITANLLQSREDISLADDFDREERATAEHDDFYGWLRFDHDPGGDLSGRTLIARTTLEGSRAGTADKSGVSTGALRDVRSFSIHSLRSEWTWPIDDATTLSFGGGVGLAEGRYEYSDAVAFDVLFDIDGAPSTPSRARSLALDLAGRQYELHATLRRRLGPRLTADVGLRWDEQTLDPVDRGTLSPRIGVRFELGARTELRAALGRFHQSQAINELPVSDGIVDFSPPQRSDHLVLGLQHYFPSGVGLRVEAYGKRMTQLRPRYENLLNDRILLPELKPDRIRIAPDSAAARGVEIMLDGRTDALGWWVMYSWSEALDRVAGSDVPRSWDQPHALGGGLTLESEKWSVGLGARTRSGWPTTPVSLDAGDELPPRLTVGERNSLRLDDHASIDVRAARTLTLSRSSLTISFELTNALDHDNSCCIEYEMGDAEESGLLLQKDLFYVGRVPSIGLLWKF